MKETIELQTATEVKDSTGRMSKTYVKATDLTGIALQVDSHREERPQGTIIKRQFEFYLKGSERHATILIGNGVVVRGVTCDIWDLVDFPGRLLTLKLRER